MRLTDIMSYANLSSYAEIALVIFLGVYALVAIITLVRRDRHVMQEAASMPLHDGTAGVTQGVKQDR